MSDRESSRDSSSPSTDARGKLRRTASATKASIRRSLKRVAKIPARVAYRLNRAWLHLRKWTREYAKAVWHAMLRVPKLARKHSWMTRRWFRRRRRMLWRRLTQRKIDAFDRARTAKRAQDLAVVPLDAKPFEVEKIDRQKEIRALRVSISRMARSRTPVIVGPWLSEIGFELLYWIPFVHWAKAYGNLRDRDLWVVSRGGVRSWYGDVTDNYVDIFEHYDPDEFRERNIERQREQGGIKHRAVSGFDEEILDKVQRQLGVEQYELLHPSMMYGFLHPFFQKLASFRLVEAFSFYSKIRPEPAAPVAGLPDDYVAVKFYANDALPATTQNQQLLARVLAGLTERGHVVSLDTGTSYDDHAEFADLAPGRLHTIDDLVPPAENLELQTRIIHNARTLYCTYGGFSYLGPLSGTRTVTFYSDRRGFRLEHLEMARRVFTALGCPPFLALDAQELPFLVDLALLQRRSA